MHLRPCGFEFSGIRRSSDRQAGQRWTGSAGIFAAMFLRAFERQDGGSVLVSRIGFMPFLEHDEVPEHPRGVGFCLLMISHQVLNDGTVKDALIADPLFG